MKGNSARLLFRSSRYPVGFFGTALLVMLVVFTAVDPVFAADWTSATVPSEMYSGWVDDPAGEGPTITRGVERLIEDSGGNVWAYVRNRDGTDGWDSSIFVLKSAAPEWVRFDQGIDDRFPAENWRVWDMVALEDEIYVSTEQGVFARTASEAAWRQVGGSFDPYVFDLVVFDGCVWGNRQRLLTGSSGVAPTEGLSGIYRFDPASDTWSAANQGLPADGVYGDAWRLQSSLCANQSFLYVGLFDGVVNLEPRDPTFSKTGVYRWKTGGSSWAHVGLSIDPRDHGATDEDLRELDVGLATEEDLLRALTEGSLQPWFWGPSWIAVADGYVVCQLWVIGLDLAGKSVTEWHEWQVFDEATTQWERAAPSGEYPKGWPFVLDRSPVRSGEQVSEGEGNGDQVSVSGQGALISPEGRIIVHLYGWSGSGPGVVSLDEFDPASSSWGTRSQPVVRWEGGLIDMRPMFMGDVLVLAADSPPAPTTPSTAPGFVPSVPLPTQISKDPGVIGTNFALALVFAAIFGLTSTLFNSTLKTKNAEITRMLGSLGGLWSKVKAALSRPAVIRRLVSRRAPVGRRLLEAFAIVIIAGLIYALLDPGFGLSTYGLTIFVSMALAIAVVTYGYEGIQALISSRRYRAPAAVKLFPIAIGVAIVCVLLSRLTGFRPGYLYGFVGGMAFLGAQELDDRKKGRLVLLATGCLFAVSLAAWFLAAPITNAVDSGSSWLKVLQGICVATFVVGLEGLFFGLIPLSFTDGGTLFRWNKVVWAMAFGIAAFLFWHVLLNKNSKYGAAFAQTSVRVVVALLVFWTLVTVGTYWYFRKPSGPPNIKDLERKGDVPGLIEALRYRKAVWVRSNAAEALGGLGDARAVEPLVAALKSASDYHDWQVADSAVQALGRLGDTRAVETLTYATAVDDGDVRESAREALHAMGVMTAVAEAPASVYPDLHHPEPKRRRRKVWYVLGFLISAPIAVFAWFLLAIGWVAPDFYGIGLSASEKVGPTIALALFGAIFTVPAWAFITRCFKGRETRSGKVAWLILGGQSVFRRRARDDRDPTNQPHSPIAHEAPESGTALAGVGYNDGKKVWIGTAHDLRDGYEMAKRDAQILSEGYCPTCHEVKPADDGGCCQTCGGVLIDVHERLGLPDAREAESPSPRVTGGT